LEVSRIVFEMSFSLLQEKFINVRKWIPGGSSTSGQKLSGCQTALGPEVGTVAAPIHAHHRGSRVQDLRELEPSGW